MHINYIALILSTVLAFIFATVYYIILNKQVIAARRKSAVANHGKDGDLRTTLTPNKVIIELTRTFVTGLVIAYAIQLLNLGSVYASVLMGFWLWLGFPVVLLLGSVIHEHFPPKLAVIHAGDWLAKIWIFCVILSLWK